MQISGILRVRKESAKPDVDHECFPAKSANAASTLAASPVCPLSPPGVIHLGAPLVRSGRGTFHRKVARRSARKLKGIHMSNWKSVFGQGDAPTEAILGGDKEAASPTRPMMPLSGRVVAGFEISYRS